MSEGVLNFDSVVELLDRLGPTPPERWLVRSSALSPEVDLAVNSLGLPERLPPTDYLPEGVAAIVFSRITGSHGLGLGGIYLTALTYDGSDAAAEALLTADRRA